MAMSSMLKLAECFSQGGLWEDAVKGDTSSALTKTELGLTPS